MAFSFGFYNAIESNGVYDREYDAVQMSELFDGLINDGVYATIGQTFAVRWVSGLEISVGTGRAWFNHTWNYNDSLITFTLDGGDPLYDRIDSVVIDINAAEAVRTNQIMIIKGTPASKPVAPTLINDTAAKHYQHLLANILIPYGATAISQGRITNKVGVDSTCKFVVSPVVDSLRIDNIVASWEAKYEEWFADLISTIGYEPADNFVNLYNRITEVENNVNTTLADYTNNTLTPTINNITATSVNKTILTTGWSGNTYTITGITGATSTSYNLIMPQANITDAARKAWLGMSLFVTGQGNGTITIKNLGVAPTTAVPITIVVRKQ